MPTRRTKYTKESKSAHKRVCERSCHFIAVARKTLVEANKNEPVLSEVVQHLFPIFLKGLSGLYLLCLRNDLSCMTCQNWRRTSPRMDTALRIAIWCLPVREVLTKRCRKWQYGCQVARSARCRCRALMVPRTKCKSFSTGTLECTLSRHVERTKQKYTPLLRYALECMH